MSQPTPAARPRRAGPAIAVVAAALALGASERLPAGPDAPAGARVLGTRITRTAAAPAAPATAGEPAAPAPGTRVTNAAAAPATPSTRPVPPPAAERRAFTLRGSVDGLYPGRRVNLLVTVTNPNAFAIRVESLDTVVAAPRPGCPGTAVVVAPLAEPAVVPRNSSATVSLSARMAPDAPDACKNATFGLTYSGTAVMA